MKKYKFTYKEEGDNMEMIVEAKHKEEARAIFKKNCGAKIPLNYRFKEIHDDNK